MSAVIALNYGDYFGQSTSRGESIDEKAMAFFRRAEASDALEQYEEKNYLVKTPSRPEKIEGKALEFFRRAELSDVLISIWEFIKRQRFSTALKVIKAFAMITAAILLSQSISIAGIFALLGSIGGLLIAAITSVHVWFVYIPLYFVKPSDFASSALLALGLTWLAGVSPFIALVFSPLILLGLRMVEQSSLAQKPVGELLGDIGQFAGQAADNIVNTVRGILRQAMQPALVPPPANQTSRSRSSRK